ncbi:MAG TPA: VOC family protein [Propionibacteriaceae bacterium]|nr:VOC family protein [Propionibacteriaceae bacterium]
MTTRPAISATSVTVMAPDPPLLARFYARLLGAELTSDDAGWAQLRTAEGFTISVEEERQWQRPVWPATPGSHTSTMHLDLRVEDLAAAEAWAVECGAVASEFQPQDDVRVMIDPAGHPFCLFL